MSRTCLGQMHRCWEEGFGLHAARVVSLDACGDVHAAESGGGEDGAASAAGKVLHTGAAEGLRRRDKVARVEGRLLVEEREEGAPAGGGGQAGQGGEDR